MNIPTPLIHYSDKPLVEPRSTADPGTYGRPYGLWVSVGDAWLADQYNRWRERGGGNPDLIGGSAHYPHRFEYPNEIIIADNSNILVVANETEFKAFNDQYAGLRPEFGPKSRIVKWRDMRKDYNGIIIAPHHKNLAERISANGNPLPIPEFLWYYTWVVASGCIWDVSVIAGIKTEIVKLPPILIRPRLGGNEIR